MLARKHLAETAWTSCRRSRSKPFEQPEEVWAAWTETRQDALKDVLFRHNQRLASKVAHQWAEMCEIEYADLEQLASIGLLKAIDRFDPTLGNKFSSYAMPWVKGEILHFLRDKGRLYSVPRKAREIKASVVELQRYLLKGGGLASLEECAEAKGISPEEWQWICEATEKRPVGELKEAIHVADEKLDWERERAYEALQQELMMMPDSVQRTFLLEHYWQGLKVEAIAKKHKQSVEFVEAQLKAGMDVLKENSKLKDLA